MPRAPRKPPTSPPEGAAPVRIARARAPRAKPAAPPTAIAPPPPGSLLTEEDLYLFHEGSHFHIQTKLAAHPALREGAAGVQFGVWAPNAVSVSVIGDFNSWDGAANPLAPRGA